MEKVRIPRRIEQTIETEDTKISLDQVVDHLINQNLKPDELITNIFLNKEAIDLNNIQNILVDNGSSVMIEVKSSLEIAFDSLYSANEYIDEISASIKETVDLFQANKLPEANAHFASSIELIELYTNLMNRVFNTLRRNYSEKFKDIIGRNQNIEIHLLSVLKALIPAKENNDYIMLCDLLEYELLDNLKQWKVRLIPELKTLMDN